MQLNRRWIGITTLLLLLVGWGNSVQAQADEAPFGLQWGMSKEDVEAMQIRLCCRQLGKWGERYEVNDRDFDKLPKALGDEEKIYVYFGNDNKLLRIYVAITKIDGKNRYNQIRLLLEKKYDVLKACDWTAASDCNGYKAFTSYQKGEISVFVGFEENLTYRDKIFMTFVNTKLFKGDKDSQNPF
jgi:hypothetical protein